MTLGRLWAGRIYGTNTGNVFLNLSGEDLKLTGVLHVNEPDLGLYVYSVSGSFDGSELSLSGASQTHIEGRVLGHLTTRAALNPKGDLVGQWQTSIGSAGTFHLFPHDPTQVEAAATEKSPDQLHTARHHFGAIEIDRDQITALAEEIQRDFKKMQVVVTVVAGTEQSRFLKDFKALAVNTSKATILKLFVQEPDSNGINMSITVEFGPQINMAMTQGADEAWVLGMLEKIKRNIIRLERTYTTNFKKMGIGINQFLLFGAIVYLPSMQVLMDRAILMIAVFILIYGVNWSHNYYLSFADIYLDKKPAGFWRRVAPTLISWLIAATAGIVATLLAAYLQGYLNFRR